MKSKQDIHLAIAVLTMMALRPNPDKHQTRLARKSASILCWVLGYPSDFDTFMDKVKSDPPFDISPDKLDEIIKQSIEAVKQHQAEDGGFNE
jgi:hypothetical protein